MRQVRVLLPKGLFHGTRLYKQGDVIAVHDDHRAARLVELKHVEYVAIVAIPVENAGAPKGSERAVSSRSRG